MKAYLKESEQLELERQTFRCGNPDCEREYTALEAQLLLMPGQYIFHCGHCNEVLKEVYIWLPSYLLYTFGERLSHI